jgi:Gpi18-like mannosyltransferase
LGKAAKRSSKQEKKERATVSVAPAPSSSDGDTARATSCALTRREILAAVVILAVGFFIRLFFMPAEGHATDIGTFESWTLSLIKYGIHDFYGHAGFVDYPPGYMIVLGAFGWVYSLFSHFNLPFDLLKFTVKAPPVLADLGLAYLTFLIVRRTWSTNAGIWAMALVVFNPAVWFVSAYWGQGDSVTAVFVIWSVYFMVTKRFELGWLMFGFAVLIKPQPIVIAPVLLIWQLRSGAALWRLALIPVVGFLVAYGGSVAFAPDTNPVNVITWLYERYHTGTALYPYNSCNAFNLYSTRLDFWQRDDKLIPDLPWFQGWPQWAWGVTIVAAFIFAVAVREWRTLGSDYNQQERESSFYMALFLSLLGLFMFATRMHERYLFSALAFGPLIFNIGLLNRFVYFTLSATFLANLFYALQYLYSPSADLAPWLVHPLSILNVGCLFLVAGAYLVPEIGDALNGWLDRMSVTWAAENATRREAPLAREGLVGLTLVDFIIVGGLMAVTAVLLYTNISRPGERIFDEIYYARSAQEYIQHHFQFEWTHPPLSKLILTIGAMIYKVDPIGARLMSALFGTLTVPLLYAFAKRLFASSAAAVAAVSLLISSGYFYVQSRIATPEIFVAFFALLTVYCMYRFWLGSQVVRSRQGVIYPDGSRIQQNEVVFEFGERLPLKAAKLETAGQTTQWTSDGARVDEDGNSIEWHKDGSISGTADTKPVRDSQLWAFWLVMTCVAVGCVISSKWNGLFDLVGIWGVALAVTLQRRLPWVPERSLARGETPKRFVWGNAYGFRLPIFVLGTIVITLCIYLLTYIPFFQIGASNLGLHNKLGDLWELQKQMWYYHHGLKATHPYSSEWWTWPLELRPVSYYYHVFSGTSAPNQIVAEVIAVPNPLMWILQIATVPAAAILAWRARHKGVLLCVAAYFFQWLPWIASTRIDFQYNFYPNTAIICLCTTYVLVRIWQAGEKLQSSTPAKVVVVGYLVACLALFVFFMPILNGQHITWKQWDARIWYKDGVPHKYGWI